MWIPSSFLRLKFWWPKHTCILITTYNELKFVYASLLQTEFLCVLSDTTAVLLPDNCPVGVWVDASCTCFMFKVGITTILGFSFDLWTSLTLPWLGFDSDNGVFYESITGVWALVLTDFASKSSLISGPSSDSSSAFFTC